MTGKEYAKKEYPNLEEGQKQMLAKAFDTGKDYAETDLASIAYMQGAEPREKRIAELEKGNTELKKKLKEKLKTIADKDLSFVAKFDALEKENAELGEQLLVVSEQLRLAKEMPYSAVKKFAEEKTQEQLTKATELLQRFIKWARTENCEKFDVILADAEQFLQEIKE